MQKEDSLLSEILRLRKFIIRKEELQYSDTGSLNINKKQLNLRVA